MKNITDIDRHLIPQWRDFETTLKLNELFNEKASIENTHENILNSLFEKKMDWEENKTVPYALDFISSALVANEFEQASEAAKFILSKDGEVNPLAIKQSILILGEKDILDIEICNINEFQIDNFELNNKINYLKKILIQDPFNSIVWADLSREYAKIGRPQKAIRCMEVALNISPENRFILRSACRLFMHIDDFERAHQILKKSALIKTDPWIMASEISAASIMNKTSQFIKQGRNLITGNNYHNFSLTELESEIGTLEFKAGDFKKAKRLFTKSLDNPNDNSYAQAVWISRELPLNILLEVKRNIPCAFEAEAFRLVGLSEWQKGIFEISKWLIDLPYSGRPAVLGSYIASTVLEDYKKSEEFARFGLKANPKDNTILNNLTFSLIQQGKLQEAENEFAKIRIPETESIDIITFFATSGLLSFRKNNFEQGRHLYLKAIQMADKTNNIWYKVVASIYLAIEEIGCKSEYAQTAFEDATRNSKDTEDAYIKILYDRLNSKFLEIY